MMFEDSYYDRNLMQMLLDLIRDAVLFFCILIEEDTEWLILVLGSSGIMLPVA
jgi:hypothetical protein